MNYLSRFAVLIVLFLVSTTHQLVAQTAQPVTYHHAVIVTSEPRASNVGKGILQKGGNAVDAAAAVQFALAVTLPRAGNIGGGGFMALHLADGTNITLDFREKAPAEATKNMFVKNGKYQPSLSRRSILASGVPGIVDGMAKAVSRYGNLTLKEDLQPAIALAENGYQLSRIQAKTLNDYAGNFKQYASSKEYFTPKTNNKFEEGDLFVQNDLAATLKRIAQHGRRGFYSGKTAQMIIKEVKRQDGIITRKDLHHYQSKWRKPVETHFRGFDLHIMPPPSSGGIAIHQILTMLEPYNLRQLGFNSADYVHLVAEAMRRTFADRAYFLGDPDYIDVPNDSLLSDSYNRHRMQRFSWRKATSSDSVVHGDIPGFKESLQTTHFSIFDSQGNAVAITTTLNGNFGNKIAVDGAGFFLNNEMDDFTAQPGKPNMFGLIQGKANAVEGGKRMLSSMSPTIVTKDGEVRMVLGAAGGPRIINATLQNFLNLAVFGMDANQAVSAPRFHHQWRPDKLFIERYGLSPDTQKLLQLKGHHLKKVDGLARANIIFINENRDIQGASDPRAHGASAGY